MNFEYYFFDENKNLIRDFHSYIEILKYNNLDSSVIFECLYYWLKNEIDIISSNNKLYHIKTNKDSTYLENYKKKLLYANSIMINGNNNKFNNDSEIDLFSTPVKNKDDECGICLETTEDCVKLHNCNHTFHKKCINTWFKQHKNCPICRNTLFVKKLDFNLNKRQLRLFNNWDSNLYEIPYHFKH